MTAALVSWSPRTEALLLLAAGLHLTGPEATLHDSALQHCTASTHQTVASLHSLDQMTIQLLTNAYHNLFHCKELLTKYGNYSCLIGGMIKLSPLDTCRVLTTEKS